MKRLLRNVAILMCLVLLAPSVLSCLPSVQGVPCAEAAERKAKLYEKSGTIGVQSSPEYLYIENQKDKAKYSYSSKDKKIATVNKYGQITGISKGSTTITVKETYKKKTTEVGTFKVKVVNSSLGAEKDQTGMYNIYYPRISYQNFKATYTYTSSDSKIVTTNENGTLIGLSEGTATITITEKYKGETRKLGSFALTIVPSSINTDFSSIQIEVDSLNYASYIIDIDNRPWNEDVTYSYESSNPAIASVTKEVDEYDSSYSYDCINGVAVGSATITVYETYNSVKRTVGTVTVNVVVGDEEDSDVEDSDAEDSDDEDSDYSDGEEDYE